MNGSTIRDVARFAGVSIATVSRAMNTPDKVRPATLSRIQNAIEELGYNQGYAQSAAAASIDSFQYKNTAGKMIGFIVSDLCNSHFAYMGREIEKELSKEGYSLIVCNTDNDPEMERQHIELLLSLQVSGLIINTTCMNNEYIEEISRQLPIVLVARRISNQFHGDFVGSNNAGGMEQLTKHLLDLGHRKIGLITSDLRFSSGKERLDGFLYAMQDAGVAVEDSYIYNGKYFNEMDGVEGCQHLLSLSSRPTAIIIGNNAMALGAYKYLHTHHIDIPDELSIASYGDIDNHELFRLTPTIVTLSSAYIGQKAAACLISRIRQQHVGNREIIYEPTLVTGQTTKSLYEIR